MPPPQAQTTGILPEAPVTAGDGRTADTDSSAMLAAALRRSRLERWAFALLALLLCWLMAWDHRQRMDIAMQAETRWLEAGTRTIALNVTQQIEAAHATLQGLAADLAAAPLPPGYAAAQLRALRRAWPGLVQLRWLDADGSVLAASGFDGEAPPEADAAPVPSGPGTAGMPGDAGALQGLRAAMAQPGVMTVRARRDETGQPQTGMQLLLPVVRATAGPSQNEPAASVLVAELDKSFFLTLLRAAQTQGGMWAGLALAEAGVGSLLAVEPPMPALRGVNLAAPGTLLHQHLQSGQEYSVMSGQPALMPGAQLLAQRSLRLAQLQPQAQLAIAVSRDLKAVQEPVRQLTLRHVLMGLLAGLLLLAGMLQLQRARQARAHLAQQRREQAEFLDLALRGAELGLWVYPVGREGGRWSDRMYEILGCSRAEVVAGLGKLTEMIHPEDRERVLAAQQQHLQGHTPLFEQRYRLLHPHGQVVWVLDRGRVMKRNAAGKPVQIAGTLLDISASVAAEQALRESEENLAITLHSIGDAVVATDAQGCITRMNPAAERMTAWPREEALGRPLAEVFRILGAGTRQPVPDPVQAVLASGEVVGLANDTLLLARDGTERQIADSAAPIRTAEGRLVGVVLVFSDVTEQYRMLKALREREHELSIISDALPGPVMRVSTDGTLRFANRSAEVWLGRPRQQLVGLKLAEVLGEAEAAGIAPVLERVHAGQMLQFDRRVKTVQGERDVSVTLVPDRGKAGVESDAGSPVIGHVAVLHDISPRKRAEEALRLSERKAVALLQALRSGVVVHDAQTQVLQANAAACELLGLSLEQMRGVSALDPRWHFVQADGQPMAPEQYPARQVQAGAEAVRNLVVGVVRPDRDRPVWGLCDAFAVRDSDGRLVEIVVTVHDITERFESERQLRGLQADLAATLDAVPDLLFDVDVEGVIHGHHSPRHELLSAPPQDFLGQTMDRFLPADATAVVLAALREAAEKGWAAGQQYSLPLPGGPRTFELSVARKATPEGEPTRLIALARDITERQQAQAERMALELQLREVQKMESIGTLAGGIAHDFNNILAAILGNVALARGDLEAGHPAVASLDQIQKAGLRARALVQQILAFSRRQPQQLREQPIGPVVEETLAMLRVTLPAGVELRSCLHEQPLIVRADATQLQQVLMNLCTNAWQSLPAGQGRIEVGLAPGKTGAGPEEASLAVHLWVRDTGSGIDPAIRDRLFDPFFTTKPVGQGTGLGLSVVHGIVRGHGGRIELESEPGHGTTFHVWLPAVAAAEADPVPVQPPVPLPAAMRGSLLYVDDDEVMVLMVQRLLERAGWRVSVCSSAAQALQAVAQQRFDAVVSDYNMPAASGLDLARQLRVQAPDLPVIISSGYISDELRTQATALGVSALLKKEQTLDALPALLDSLVSRP